jgi:hypothetical protein
MATKEEIDKLKKRIDVLEWELKSIKISINSLEGNPSTSIPSSETPKKSDSFYELPPRPSIREKIEAWLGGNLIGKSGFLAIILAFIWFLTYAFENYWINESGRIYISLLVGFVLWGGSFYFARKKYEKLPGTMLGTGISILFLGIFSAYKFYSLVSLEEVFFGLVLLSAASIGLAYIARSQVLYIFGMIGAFLNPILLSSGENSYKFLFSYLIIWNLVHLLISSRFYWRFSALFIPIFNLVLYQGWASSSLDKSSFTFPFLFLIVAFVALLTRELYLQLKLTERGHWTAHVAILVGVLGYGTEVFVLCGKYSKEFAPLFLLGFSLIPAAFLAFRSPNIPISKTTPFLSVGGLGSVFLLILALQSYAEGEWLHLGFVLAGGSLAVLGAGIRNERILLFGSLIWLSALFYLIFGLSGIETKGIFLFNTRFLVYAIASGVLFSTHYLLKDHPLPFFSKAYLVVSLFILIFGTFSEVYHYTSNRYYQNLGYSYVLALYSALFLIPGFIKNSHNLRKFGLILITILIIKFYIYDIWTLSLIVKIIAAFTLGIGLVITGIFFEKFKAKLFGGNNMTPILLILSLGTVCLFTEDLAARPFKDKGFKYYKTVQLPKKEISGEFGRIVLDSDILENAQYYDIRVVQGKVQIPFLQRSIKEENTAITGQEVPTIIQTEKMENGKRYILKFPKPPANTVFSSLVISAASTFEAEVNVTPLMSMDGDGFPSSGKVFFYETESDKEENRMIQFSKNGRFQYARVEVTGSDVSFQFPSVKYIPIYKTKISSIPVDISTIQSTDDTDILAKVYTIDTGKKIPFSQIRLDFEEEIFDRNIIINEYSSIEKSFSYPHSFQIKRTKENIKEPVTINLNFDIKDRWKLSIFYVDDKPLTLKSIEMLSSEQEIIFPLKPEVLASSEPIQIYYGNPYSLAPDFDPSWAYALESKSSSIQTFTISNQEKNANFAYDMMEPPVSTWIIRVFFFLGLGIFGFFGYRIYKQYGIEMEGRQD